MVQSLINKAVGARKTLMDGLRYETQKPCVREHMGRDGVERRGEEVGEER
jgi:hypothetical protein